MLGEKEQFGEFINKYGIAKTLIEENIDYPGMKAGKFMQLSELKEFIQKYNKNCDI